MAGGVVDLLDRDAEERLLRIDFFPVVADSVKYLFDEVMKRGDCNWSQRSDAGSKSKGVGR